MFRKPKGVKMRKKKYPNEGSPVEDFSLELFSNLEAIGLNPAGDSFTATITMDNGQKIHGQIDALSESSRFLPIETSYIQCPEHHDGFIPASITLVDVMKISSISIKNKKRSSHGVIGPDLSHLSGQCPMP